MNRYLWGMIGSALMVSYGVSQEQDAEVKSTATDVTAKYVGWIQYSYTD